MRTQHTSHESTFSLVTIISAFAWMLLISTSAFTQETRDAEKDKMIRDAVGEIVANENIPGMIAAISDSKGVIAIGSAGIRKAKEDVELTNEDIFHIGSCTKAMTSTLLATFVAEGLLTWETTLLDVFPELKKDIHPDYLGVTLRQLVTHQAGIPANAEDWWNYPKKDLSERRLAILKDNLKEAPALKAGTFNYSNLGYMAAGCMMEKLTGKTWESLIKERIFDPLGMTSAGFGPPGTRSEIDQPWGHVRTGKNWRPRHFDNADALGPAGRVHCTVEDWAKFIALQLPENNPTILSREQLDELIGPEEAYAAGWGIAERPWAKGKALSHNGSNNMWYAVVWVAPNLDRAYIAITNSSDKNSNALCDKMIGKLIAIDSGTSDK